MFEKLKRESVSCLGDKVRRGWIRQEKLTHRRFITWPTPAAVARLPPYLAPLP